MRALALLRDAWREEEPSRARGGIVAVAGFEYQFLQTIREVLRQWQRADDRQRADPLVFAETLSDVAAAADDGALIVVQVKRTLTRRRLEATLDEFWKLERLARRVTPGCPLRFRVLCANGDEQRADRWRKEWANAGVPSRKVLASRVRISVEPDTRVEVLAILANDLRASDPLATLSEALGYLMHAVTSAGGVESASESVWNALVRAEREISTGGPRHIWTQGDRAPARVKAGPVLTGERPRIHHLRTGYLAPRLAVVDHLHAALERWRAAPRRDPGRVDVLWLTGPSGAGKSIALLWLLQRVHEKDDTPIVYLRDAVDELAVTAGWAQRAFADYEWVILALDDPYPSALRRDVSPAWRRALAVLTSEAPAEDGPAGRPLLVIAGSAEQARAFQRDFSGDIYLQQIGVPPPDRQEVEALRHWFRRRTRTEVNAPSNPAQPLLWTVFEWCQGDLTEFAERLRRRVSELDDRQEVLQALERTLALNSHGLGMPEAALRAWLTDEQRDALSRLLNESSLPRDPLGSGGYVLLHQRLATHIYEAWHTGQERQTRTGHLADAMVAALRYAPSLEEQALPVLALAGRHIGDVDLDVVVERTYGEATSHGDANVDVRQLPAWLRLMGRGFELGDRRVLHDALARLHPQSTTNVRTPEIASELLRATSALGDDERSDVLQTVTRLLEASPEWHAFARVAAHAIAAFDDASLVTHVIDWVDAHKTAAAAHLMRAALSARPESPVIRQAAERLLAQRDHPAWAVVWASLVTAGGMTESRAAAAERWLEAKEVDAHGWSFVWARLWNLGGETINRRALQESGQRYLEDSDWSQSGFSFIWIPLWEREEADRSRLADLGFAWLRDPRTLSERGYAAVFRRVRHRMSGEADDRFEALRTLGLSWLSQAPEHPGWSYMLRTLWDYPRDRDELITFGVAWLRATDVEHRGWASVYSVLFDEVDEEQRERLIGLGQRWLREVSDGHDGRRYVFGQLMVANPSLELLEEGAAWLDRSEPSNHSWTDVWEKLGGLKHPHGMQRALRYLADDDALDQVGWTYVWGEVWMAAPSEHLVGRAAAWLSRHPAHRGRSYVVRPLLGPSVADDLPGAADDLRVVVDDTLRWLHDPAAWGDGGDLVWRLLWERRPDLRDRMRPAGMAWLDSEHGRDHIGWGPTMHMLWDEAPNEELQGVIHRWARSASGDALGWPFVGGITWHTITAGMDLDEHDLSELIRCFADPGAQPTRPTALLAAQRLESVAHGRPRAMRDSLVISIAPRLIAKLSGEAAGDTIQAVLRLLARRPRLSELRTAAVKLATRLPAEQRAAADLLIDDTLNSLETWNDPPTRSAILSAFEVMKDPRLEAHIRMALSDPIEDSSWHSVTMSNAIAICGRHEDVDLAREALRRTVEIARARPLDRRYESVYTAAARLHDRLAAMPDLDAEDQALVDELRERYNRFREAHPAGSLRLLTDPSVVSVEADRAGRMRRLLRYLGVR